MKPLLIKGINKRKDRYSGEELARLVRFFEILIKIDKKLKKDKNILENNKHFFSFVNKQTWTFAKTMPEIPHFYIVRDNLSELDKELFDKFNTYINQEGYTAEFYSQKYTYYNLGNYKYWVLGNILNRAAVSENNLIKEDSKVLT